VKESSDPRAQRRPNHSTVRVIDGLDVQLKGPHHGALAQELARMENLRWTRRSSLLGPS